MTRRGILRAIAGVALAVVAPIASAVEWTDDRYWVSKKWGLITAKEHSCSGFKVFVNGMEVTNVCFEADDVAGYVKCFEWEGYPLPPLKPIVFKNSMKWAWAERGDGITDPQMMKARAELDRVTIHGSVRIAGPAQQPKREKWI